jgi:predicted glutamine amidotransferase
MKEDNLYRMTRSSKRQHLVVVASEPLTFERQDWIKVPRNTMLVITEKTNVKFYPILDEYYNPEAE